MNRMRFALYVVLIALLLVSPGSMNITLAQRPEPEGEIHPQSDTSAADTVGLKFSYQGVLKEGGSPVTGIRDMEFRLYADDACTDLERVVTKPGVKVTDGLFRVIVDGLSMHDVDGRALWLKVKVGAMSLGCQEIVPVPYALSLMPGAEIANELTLAQLVRGWGYPRHKWAAVYGQVSDYSGPGVGDVYGGYFESTGSGHGVYATSVTGDGVIGTSTQGHGVAAYGDATGGAGAALWAENTREDEGIAIWARAKGEDSTVVLEQDEANGGSFLKAYQTDPSNLRFRLRQDGMAYADGAWSTPASDFAEMLPAVDGPAPGDVLVVGPDGKLHRSDKPCAANVVGVYSTDPGFVGGSHEDGPQAGEVPLAVVGVVPVNATAEGGSIAPGDLLVASSTPGHAMKAGRDTAVGTVLGKALEPLDGAAGVITILVMLQ